MSLDFSTLIVFYQENFFIKVKPTIENKLARHEMSFRTYLPLSIFLPLLLSLSFSPLSLCHCHPFPWSSLSLFWSSTDLLSQRWTFLQPILGQPVYDTCGGTFEMTLALKLFKFNWVIIFESWCPPSKKNWWTHLQQLVLETIDYKLAPE